jgi:hypothetical protein
MRFLVGDLSCMGIVTNAKEKKRLKPEDNGGIPGWTRSKF